MADASSWQWNSGACVYAGGRPVCDQPALGEDPVGGEGHLLAIGLGPALDEDGEPGGVGLARTLFDGEEVHVETMMGGEWVTDGRMACCGDGEGLVLGGGGLVADSADSIVTVAIPSGEVAEFDEEVFGPFDDGVVLMRRTRGALRYNAR